MKDKEHGFSFSFVIIQQENTNNFYGMVKEVDGVIVKGSSEKEVESKIHKAIKAINIAKRKDSPTEEVLKHKPNFMVVKEFEQEYQPV